MIFWILPAIISIFLIGAIDISRYQADQKLPSPALSYAIASGQYFLAYRDVVDNYVMTTPGFTGSVPPSIAHLPPGMSFNYPAGNLVIKTPSGNGRIIIVWADLPQGALFNAQSGVGGDLTLGIVNSYGQFISPLTTVPSAIPGGLSLPSGYSVSIVQEGV